MTTASGNSEEDNLFVLIGLDPASTDRATVEEQIRKKQMEWNKGRSQGANPTEATRRLEKLKSLKKKVDSPEALKNEAREAKQILKERRKRALRSLDEFIRVFPESGEYTDGDVQNLERQLGKTLSRDDIEQQLIKAGLQKRSAENEAASDPFAGKPTLDRSKYARIKENLKTVGVESFYDLFELPRQTSSDQLVQKANELYRSANAEVAEGSGNATRSAKLALAGLAQDVFSDEERRRKYDNSLSLDYLQEFRPHLETAGGQQGYLTQGQLERLVNLIARRGSSVEDAEAFVKQEAKKRGWRIEGGRSDKVNLDKLQRCACGELVNQDGKQSCPTCGRSLKLACPSCGHECRADLRTCPSCGFAIGNQDRLRQLVSHAKKLEAAGALADAKAQYLEALNVWPEWPEAKDGVARVGKQIDRQAHKVEEIRSLVNEKRLAAANKRVAEIAPGEASPELETLRSQISEGLEKADAALRKAREKRRAGHRREAILACEHALEHAQDHAEARQLLAELPPPQPGRLQCEEIPSGFRLKWEPVRIEGDVSYRVVRRRDARPATADDGEKLGEPRSAQFDDASPPPGAHLYYGVFTMRAGVASAEPATVGPLLFKEPVTDLRVETDANSVTLQWQVSKDTARVRVWRRLQTPPTRAHDGMEIQAGTERAVDRGVKTGNVYGYLVVPYFHSVRAPAELVEGPAASITARPQARPDPVMDLRISRIQDDQAQIDFSSPSHGQVQIFLAGDQPKQEPGTVLSLEQLPRLGTRAPDATVKNRRISIPRAEYLVLVPVTVADHQAAFGKPIELQRFARVTNFSCELQHGNLIFSWSWPNGARLARLLIRHDRMPSGADDDAAQQLVVERGGDARARFVLTKPRDRAHYVKLAVASRADGKFQDVAETIEPLNDQVNVSYELKLQRRMMIGKITKAELELTSDKAIRLDGLALVARRDNEWPLRIDDGETIQDIENVQLRANEPKTLAVPVDRLSRGQCLRLFLKSRGAAKLIRLTPASGGRLRIP